MSRFARLHALGKRLGLGHGDLSALAREWHGVPGLPGLTDGQLAGMEMELQQRVSPVGAAPPAPRAAPRGDPELGGRPGQAQGPAPTGAGERRYVVKRFRPASITIDGEAVPLATQAQINKLLWLMTAHGYGRPQLHEALARVVKRVRGARNPLDALTLREA
ncbi:MAG: hypothetical protein AAB368_14135, partial [bacterium]